MHDREAKIVLNRLSEYGCYKELAEEAERMALLTQVAIDNCGMPSSPKEKIAPTVSAGSSDSRMLELISEQKAYEDNAKLYRRKMSDIELYIASNTDIALNNLSGKGVKVRDLMTEHFIKGRTYDDMDEFFYTKDGIRSIVVRSVTGKCFAGAKDILKW